MKHVLAGILVTAAASVARAEPADLKPVASAKLEGPAPKISIVSPASEAVFEGRRTVSPDDKYTNLDCLLDAKTFSIKLAAENWTVKPGGQGILLVVDGVYATVVHDLSKPVLVADLSPYEPAHGRDIGGGGSTTYRPLDECGPHWIAAVPTAANGLMLPVAPALSWWLNASKDIDGGGFYETDELRTRRQERAVAIVNWPLIGAAYFGQSWGATETEHRSGRVVADPKRVVLDWTTARPNGASCKLHIAAQNGFQGQDLDTDIGPRGTVLLPDGFVDRALAISAQSCGGLDDYYAMLWRKRPSPIKAFDYPKATGKEAEDYWHSADGHQQYSDHVRHAEQDCDKGDAKKCEEYRRMHGKKHR